MGKVPTQTPVIKNKKASFDYELIDKVEAGIALTGSEVKSLRDGKASLEEAYAVIRENQAYLIGFNISPYAMASYNQHHPTRERRLLLHRREIKKWADKVTLRGLTVVPLRVYFNERGLVKVQLALARGKAKSDKRESIKRREIDREISRAMKRG